MLVEVIAAVASAAAPLGVLARQLRLYRRDKVELELVRDVDRREGGTAAVDALVALRRSERPQLWPARPAAGNDSG